MRSKIARIISKITTRFEVVLFKDGMRSDVGKENGSCRINAIGYTGCTSRRCAEDGKPVRFWRVA